MHDTETNVRLLLDILEKKSLALTNILNITENQESIISSGSHGAETNSLWAGLIREKQTLIDEVVKCDNLFQSVFGGVHDALSSFAVEHEGMITEMQARVKLVMDTDVKIRVAERRNRDRIERRKRATVIDVPKASKSYVLKQYKKHNKGETN